jgi:signal peptidase I
MNDSRQDGERSVSKIKRGSIAFVLSIVVPGLGQIYNGQTLAGILLAVAFVSFMFFAGLIGLLHAFGTAVAYTIALWTFQLAVAIHAAVVAVRQVKDNKLPTHTWRSYSVVAALVGAMALVGFTVPGGILGVRAYVVPAQSMSPTLIVGDRFVADIRYYKTHLPKRGDVVVFRAPTGGMLLTKRVVAVGGETIEGGPEGVIVNGQLLSEPYMVQESDDRNSDFGPVSVPSNELFVMGDNRSESYDSRQFGSVDVNRVIGKALYVYYSSGKRGRVGHPIQ